MKYIFLILALFCANIHAQTLTVKSITVSCDAGKNSRVFNNPGDADTYAKTLPCVGRTWVAANYNYTKGSANSSSSSSAPKMVTLSVTVPTTRRNGDAMTIGEVCGFSLRRNSGFEEFKITGVITKHQTAPPVTGEKWLIAAYDCKGLYSDYVEVAQ